MLTDRMTYRQLAVVRALCAGKSKAEVAAAFGIKPATVRADLTVALTRTPKGTTIADVCRELNGEAEGETDRP